MIAPLNCSSSPKVPVRRALRPSPSPYVWKFSLGFQYPNTINPARAWSTIYFHFHGSYHSPRLRPYADSITCGFGVFAHDRRQQRYAALAIESLASGGHVMEDREPREVKRQSGV